MKNLFRTNKKATNTAHIGSSNKLLANYLIHLNYSVNKGFKQAHGKVNEVKNVKWGK